MLELLNDMLTRDAIRVPCVVLIQTACLNDIFMIFFKRLLDMRIICAPFNAQISHIFKRVLKNGTIFLVLYFFTHFMCYYV